MKYVGSNNRPLTEALFWETSRDRTAFPPVFTLKDAEHEGLPSMKALYLEMEDPTEYEFALATLGSWKHWEILTSLSWFKPYVKEWRMELGLKLKAQRVREAKRILEVSESDSARLQAAKFLAERGWEEKATKGRPKKEDVARAAREEAETVTWLSEDHKRLFGG